MQFVCRYGTPDGRILTQIQTGSDAATVVGGFLFLSGSELVGGSSGCAGDGLQISGGGDVLARGTTIVAGTPFDCIDASFQGIGVRVMEGTYAEVPGAARSFAVDSPASSGGAATLAFQGEAGDLVVLAFALSMGSAHLPGVGTLQTGLGTQFVALGNADGGGALELTLGMPAIGAGTGIGIHLQTIAVAGPEVVATGGTALVIVAP